jgi:hypothetical protein
MKAGAAGAPGAAGGAVARRPLACSGVGSATVRRHRMRVVVLRIVLAQEILAIIVAVGRAHDRVDVVA